jgi:MYXO-CTERM domain-containing protein
VAAGLDPLSDGDEAGSFSGGCSAAPDSGLSTLLALFPVLFMLARRRLRRVA